MKNKYFITVNPNSAAGKSGKDWPKIKEKLSKAGIDFDFKISQAHRENIEHVSSALQAGYRKIIGVGGDGTLHHITNAIFNQTEVKSSDIEVGLISIGTGNDWVRHHNIPTKYDEAIAVITAAKTAFQDVGKLHNENGKTEYFMNFAGIGYDAYVVENTVELKKFGQSAYLYGLVQCLFKYENQELNIEIDGKTYPKDDVFMMIAGLGKFAGGGMMLSKDALIDDGYFDLTIGKNLTKTEVIFMVHKLFNGTFNEHEKVETIRCKHIKVSAKNKEIVKAEADGELVGTGDFEISLLENALKIYVA